MPAVVTFDPLNLLIKEIDTTNDVNETDLFEIYSEWKDWLLSDPVNMGYPAAFRQVGSDPISDIQNLGSTLFLGGGWKFQPASYDHQWQITGNVFTDPAGERRTVATDTAATVEVTFFVSNLVDSAVARLDLTQLLQAVYIDMNNGVAGTDPGIGVPTNPVNNIADAFTIATRDNLSTFKIRGSAMLDRNVSNWRFEGQVDESSDTMNLNGFDVDKCAFERLTMTGAMSGEITATNCGLDLITGLAGIYRGCGFISDFSVDANTSCVFADCFSEVPGSATATCTFGSNSAVNFRNYSGGIRLSSFTTGCICSVDLDPGTCFIDADCTGGALVVRGTGYYSDETDVGSGTAIDALTTNGMVVGQKVTDTDQNAKTILGLVV